MVSNGVRGGGGGGAGGVWGGGGAVMTGVDSEGWMGLWRAWREEGEMLSQTSCGGGHTAWAARAVSPVHALESHCGYCGTVSPQAFVCPATW